MFLLLPTNAPRSFRQNLTIASCAACALVATASAGTPRLSYLFPAGGQRGAETEVLFTGTNLADARSLLFDEPGIDGTVVAEGNKVTAKIRIAPEVRLGEHTFRVVTASGVSDVRLFYVTPFPMVKEVEGKPGVPPVAQSVALGTTVFGNTPDDDQDKFEVELKKGQRLSVEVIGTRLHTQTLYDPTLTISKPDGSLLVESDDSPFTRQDPVASVIAPEDGKYLINIKDSTNSGLGQCQYLLSIGSFARPLAVYPPGGPAGEELQVKLLGDAGGPMEKKVKLPLQEDERFEIFVQGDQPTPQPNFIRVSPFPNVLESEPNNDVPTAQKVAEELPLALNGVIGEKGDGDCFKITAKKGADYDVRVFARNLRSPLDPVLAIYNDKGAQIALNDDSGTPDSYLRWKAPADGEFVVLVRDQLFRGGSTYVYRVEITPVQPKLTAWLPEMTINQNQDRRAISVPKGNRYASLVRIKRWDVGGEVQIETADLPTGVTVSAAPVDKAVDTIPMVFEAAPDAAPAAKAFVLHAKPTEPPAGVKVSSAVEHVVDIVESGNQRPFYTVRENKLALAVTDELPVKINMVAPKAPLLQGGSLNLKIVAERKNDFKGPISLTLLYSPPNVGNAGIQTIKENETTGTINISANATAVPQKWKLCVVGSADFGKGPVFFSTQLEEIEIAPPLVTGQIARTFVDQGESTVVTVKLDQKIPFEGKAKLQLLGLPPSTTADDQEITKETTEVKFNVKAGKAAPAGQHKQLFVQFSLQKDGDTMTSAFGQGGILRVDKATVAKNEEPKK
jgi:hypothetical protein